MCLFKSSKGSLNIRHAQSNQSGIGERLLTQFLLTLFRYQDK